jgi:ABC-type lipoprotein release transport system permease subunit
MTAVWTWFRLDLSRRWRSLLVLALIVAFASGTVMTALAGARRGDTALNRLLARTLPADVVALPNEPGFDWDAVRAFPEVTALTGFAVTDYRIDGIPPGDSVGTWFPSTDTEVFETIERPVILEGRLLDPTRVDEVVVTPQFLAYHEMHVGDSLTLHMFTPEQIDVMDAGDPGAPMGPTVPATIVGVVRSPWFSDHAGEAAGAVIPSPALFPAYERNFLGAEAATGYVNALIRLEGGPADIPRFKEDLARLTGRSDIDVWDLSEWQGHRRDVAGFEAGSLAVFAVTAAVAAVFIIGQAVVRHVTSTLGDLEPLRAVGMTPRETRAAVVLGPVLIAVAGWTVAAVATVVASRWFPIGTAAFAEPSPGTNVDLIVLGIGLVATVVFVAGGAVVVASATKRRLIAAAAPRRSAVATGAVRAGMPVPVVVGARFALEPGRGRHTIPVRPALIGATIGVLGVLAALTLSNGIDDAVGNLQRFGITYEAGTFVGYNGFDFAPTDEVLPAILADPDVVAVNDTPMDVAQVNDVAVSLFAIDPVDRPIDLVVTSGRAPAGAGEVALAPTAAKAAGLDVGDTARFAGTLGTRELTVSGLAFVPAGPHNDYDAGGWVTAGGYETLFDGHKFHFVLIDLRDGADVDAVAARFAEVGLSLEPPQVPTQVAELRQVRAMPVFLAGFLVVLALGAVGHALTTAVRRRSHDLAVLRAVGMNRRQSQVIVATQATILGLIGLAVGIPLGVALGRTVWRYVAERTPLLYLAPGELLVLVVLVPVVLAAVNLLAVSPSRRAARLQIAQVLRAE